MTMDMKMDKFHILKIVTKVSLKSSLDWSKERFYLKKYKSILAIDEAGRGSLAGPLSIGAILINKEIVDFLKEKRIFPLDSKKLRPREREVFYKVIKKEGVLHKHIFISSSKIDRLGIQNAFILGIKKLIEFFEPEIVFLDGLKPKELKNKSIKAFVKGDERLASLALASIVAKLKRDKYMEKIAKFYPDYSFEIHKGYGTKLHLEKIKKLGPCKIHRLSFLRNFNI
jgi:ribonuclease HII